MKRMGMSRRMERLFFPQQVKNCAMGLFNWLTHSAGHAGRELKLA
ncbi:hypothetical protein ECLT68_4997 [Escherichia coli LT-68]|nr:hypothetical protein ECLT68_4997 [Escherichia coli LT-68]